MVPTRLSYTQPSKDPVPCPTRGARRQIERELAKMDPEAVGGPFLAIFGAWSFASLRPFALGYLGSRCLQVHAPGAGAGVGWPDVGDPMA